MDRMERMKRADVEAWESFVGIFFDGLNHEKHERHENRAPTRVVEERRTNIIDVDGQDGEDKKPEDWLTRWRDAGEDNQKHYWHGWTG
jgi:hypothetical protein